jgi:hypothetical protein
LIFSIAPIVSKTSTIDSAIGIGADIPSVLIGWEPMAALQGRSVVFQI